jgi:CDP-6-deoxy-D-xylo-4-hexulose-3-dehydrase
MATDAVVAKLTGKTKAVFLTHAQGFNALTDELLSELKTRNIFLIEDVCESHGATHKGQRLGSIGWMSNFSFYYAHHMSTIEGGMVSTNDDALYEQIRVLRAHGMVRESMSESFKNQYKAENPALNPDFIFAYSAYNMRNTEIGGILGRSQLERLDANNALRTRNMMRFLERINPSTFRTDFKVEGSSNYAFNLVLCEPDFERTDRFMDHMRQNRIEFRRGSAGGGNQIRQPYLRSIVPANHHLDFPAAEHIHFFGFYIGNFPSLTIEEVDKLCEILNRG